MPVAETTDWLDGPRFVEWLEKHGLSNVKLQLGSGLERRIRDWRKGSAASVYTADKALVCLGLHLSEVPPGLYTDSPLLPDFNPTSREVQDEIARRIGRGESPSAVAQSLGVSLKVVRKYRGGDR